MLAIQALDQKFPGITPMSISPSLSSRDRHGEAEFAARSGSTLLRQWFRDPVKTASVWPSGRQLAELMVDQVPMPCSCALELGAGTGAFTQAMLNRGVAPEHLLVAEINPKLATFLRGRFPGVRVVCADARHLDTLACDQGLLEKGRVDAVVSGLGMLSMNSELRCGIMRAAFEVLGDGGRFIQFTYGPFSPVRRRERDVLRLRMRRAGLALRNLPPANVFVYQRSEEAPGELP